MGISTDITDNANPGKAIIFPLINRQIVELRGKDSLDYLQRISTADFRSLAPGKALHTLFLGRDGRIQAECVAFHRGNSEFDLIVPEACVKNLLEVLALYHFSEDISYDINPDRKVCLLLGSEATPAIYPEGSISGTGEWGAMSVTYIIFSAKLQPPVQECELGTEEQLLSLRIKKLVPETGLEITPGKTIPLEVNLKSSISFTKGCYTGQEIIARIYNLGHPANVLVRLRLESEVSPEQANLFSSDGKNVGSVTSVFYVPGSNCYDCLGIVKWALRENGTTLHLDDIPGKPQAVIVDSTGEPDK